MAQGSQQQPVRIIVEKKPSGCLGVLGVILLIGLVSEYWYVSVGILVLLVVLGTVGRLKQKKQREEKARHRPGPQDPWVNEVAVALADLGLTERARNTGAHIGGVTLEGDIGLDAERMSIFITLFATDELARQAEVALRARPEVRAAEAHGHSAVKAQGRVLYTAKGRGGVVDEFRFDEVISVVDKIALPPPLPRGAAPAVAPPRQGIGLRGGRSVRQLGAAEPDALEQLRKLGELLATGVLNEAEFETKKAELLRRV